MIFTLPRKGEGCFKKGTKRDRDESAADEERAALLVSAASLDNEVKDHSDLTSGKSSQATGHISDDPNRKNG
jgi:hypothetical protein